MQERAANKADRLLQIEQLLLAHPEGLTQAEIARRTGVHRSTIKRSLDELSNRFAVYDTDDGKLAINRDAYLTQVRFTLHEAMAVHLASRLMATTTDKHNPHAASALRKLAESLRSLAPFVSTHVHASAELMDDEAQRHDPVYLSVLETLTRAWSLGRKVRVKHQMADERVFDYVFAPYYIEPYAVGRTTHVIGFREPVNEIRTFKIERIRSIELLNERYEIPATFDPAEVLADAWGIWYTDTEPVEVVLRFHPRVVYRVQETRWHRNERLEPQPDGSLVWRARVAEPQELLHWVRGWGGDVEVLAPETLREAVVQDVRRMARAYGVKEMTKKPEYWLLWAKADKLGRTHPLMCHLLDVTAVMQVLWDEGLPDSIRNQMATALGLDVPQAGRTLSFLAGAHDLGKASPCFQCRVKPAWQRLQNEIHLPSQDQLSRETCYHGTITSSVLADWLQQNLGFSVDWARDAATTVGGHHGHWPTAAELEVYAPPGKCGEGKWEEIRFDLLCALAASVKPSTPRPPQLQHAERSAFFALLGGLTTVADWLGSNEDYFPFVSIDTNLEEYFANSLDQAQRALRETGWVGWQPPTEAIDFETLCNVAELRPLQEAVVQLGPQIQGPGLVIMEAPTGVGKTEAALYLADYWAYTLQQRGTYVAMPTMATSNLMFDRVKKILKCRYPDSIVNYHLLHGNALLMDSDDLPRLTKIGAREEKEGTVAALSWFTKSKRGLLAPFAVGTVDQALLSILQTPHFFVRLLGLSHKTIIFDEVHAYDTYMEELFFLLLHWLRAVNASVIILSATLPDSTRRRLVSAYAGIDQNAVVFPAGARYPMVTWTTGEQPQTVNLPSKDERFVALERVVRQPTVIAERLATLLCDGGCAAVLCNTVERARDVFDTLRNDPLLTALMAEEDFILFHARFPLAWRLEIEDLVKKRFGKPNSADEARQIRRPAIVVATQVIEQSLDLDFDLMVSDLAPIDLIIQRAGRLHRHAERDDFRPEPLRQTRLLLAMPDLDADGLPDLPRGDQWIYGKSWLLRSYLALRHLPELVTSRDTSALIESVYDSSATLPGADSAPFAAALQSAWEQSETDRRKTQSEAERNLIVPPSTTDFLEHPNADLEEDNPELHRYRQAATRLSPPSVTLICLHRAPDGRLFLDPELSGPVVSIGDELDQSMARALVNRKVEISDYDVVGYFVFREVPKPWRGNPWLRHARLAIFQHGICEYDDLPLTLKLYRKLGLYVEDRR